MEKNKWVKKARIRWDVEHDGWILETWIKYGDEQDDSEIEWEPYLGARYMRESGAKGWGWVSDDILKAIGNFIKWGYTLEFIPKN